jgi:EmrB/QacA subfamily drug resistance transporter
VTLERRRRLTLLATALGSSLAFVDATVVVVALPTIEDDLGLGLSGQQWVFVSYSLALASLYLAAGAIGDRRGRRETFMLGIVGFAAASALAGAAPTGGVLLAARALQGICGALVTTNSLALLREVYGPDSGRAVGLWTSLTGTVTIAGPPVGGAIVEWASWRWIFFLNLPLAAGALALARVGACAATTHERVGRLDVRGALLAAIGFGTLTFGLVEAADHGFGDVWWAFAAAVAALAAFVVAERRTAEPMLPFALFRRRNFAAANLETLLVYAALGGLFFYLTIYLQSLGFSPFEASLASLPSSIVLIVLGAYMGRMADARGPRRLLIVGPVLIGAATLLLLLVDERADFWRVGVVAILLFAFGLSLVVAPITSTALASAPPELSGVASGVNQTVSRLGQLISVAVVGLVAALVFESQGGPAGTAPFALDQPPGAHDASVDAFRAGMLIVAGLAFAGAAIAALGISNEDARAARQAEASA